MASLRTYRSRLAASSAAVSTTAGQQNSIRTAWSLDQRDLSDGAVSQRKTIGDQSKEGATMLSCLWHW